LDGSPHAKHLDTLRLFAYGTYREFLKRESELIEITPVQKKKLQHLTIVTLATKTKVCATFANVIMYFLDAIHNGLWLFFLAIN
jgi:hypothetical protein